MSATIENLYWFFYTFFSLSLCSFARTRRRNICLLTSLSLLGYRWFLLYFFGFCCVFVSSFFSLEFIFLVLYTLHACEKLPFRSTDKRRNCPCSLQINQFVKWSNRTNGQCRPDTRRGKLSEKVKEWKKWKIINCRMIYRSERDCRDSFFSLSSLDLESHESRKQLHICCSSKHNEELEKAIIRPAVKGMRNGEERQ